MGGYCPTRLLGSALSIFETRLCYAALAGIKLCSLSCLNPEAVLEPQPPECWGYRAGSSTSSFSVSQSGKCPKQNIQSLFSVMEVGAQHNRTYRYQGAPFFPSHHEGRLQLSQLPFITAHHGVSSFSSAFCNMTRPHGWLTSGGNTHRNYSHQRHCHCQLTTGGLCSSLTRVL